MSEPHSFEDNIIYLVGEITRLAHKQVSSIFMANSFDVTFEQFGVLTVLWYEDGTNQQTIADQLNRDKTTITRIIKNMIKRNLIVQVPDQLDKRNKLIYLTEKGKSLQNTMMDATAKVYLDALGGIKSEEIRSLTSSLKRMKNNLNQ